MSDYETEFCALVTSIAEFELDVERFRQHLANDKSFTTAAAF
jgi:hypothetical protein